ncbi:MAG: DnaJ domain-containing protein [Leptolyngbyaceae cyanobacterium]
MTSSAFSTDWIKQFSDPYAVLGVSVTADERRISKRYRQIAKQLHPDQQIDADESAREFAGQMLTRLVNPAYQRLKQDKGRAETLATLRFKVRRLTREEKLVARQASSKHLMEAEEVEVEVSYEKLLSELAGTQYSSAEDFIQQTTAIAELNLIYLRRKMGDPVIREKRIGLVAATTTQKSDASYAGANTTTSTVSSTEDTKSSDYAQRHISRAKAYINKKSYTQAIQELRDAVRIEPKNSQYHSMLGQAYLLQKMVGMSKVHFRQALRLDPNNLVALKYARKLEIDPKQLNSPKRGNTAPKSEGRFTLFNRPSDSNRNGHHKKRGFFSFLTRSPVKTRSPVRTHHSVQRQGWLSRLFGRSAFRK